MAAREDMRRARDWLGGEKIDIPAIEDMRRARDWLATWPAT